jgi:DNA polymerase-3 subunit chi
VTQIDFYTHASNPLAVAVRLIEKAWERKLPVWVRTADETSAQQLSQLLWTHSQLSFIPHCLSTDPLATETPVVIDAKSLEPSSDQVLINLHAERPDYFSRFHRLLEIVGTTDADLTQARQRYSWYRDRGFTLQSHRVA